MWLATLCVSPKNNWLKTFTSLNLYLCKTWKATCQQHVSCQSNIACIWSETPAAGNHVCNKILLAMINKEAESGEEKNRTKCGPWKQRVGQTKEIDEEREIDSPAPMGRNSPNFIRGSLPHLVSPPLLGNEGFLLLYTAFLQKVEICNSYPSGKRRRTLGKMTLTRFLVMYFRVFMPFFIWGK